MIKVITNNNTGSKITVECRAVYRFGNSTAIEYQLQSNSTYGEYFDITNVPTYIYFEVNFVGVDDNELINYASISPFVNCSLTSARTFELSITNVQMEDLNSYTKEQLLTYASSSSITVIDKIGFTSSGNVEIDLTKIIRLNPSRRSFIFFLRFVDSRFIFINPYYSSNVKHEKIATAVIGNKYGLDNRKTYHSYSIFDDNVATVDIFNGEMLFRYSLFSTNDRHLPINLSLSFFNKSTNYAFYNFILINFSMSFEYIIYLEEDDYIIENYLGDKRFYEKINSSEFGLPGFYRDYGFESSSIPNGADVYFSKEDRSYFFISDDYASGSLNYKDVALHSQNGVTILFKMISYRLYILETIDNNGQSIIYEWSSIYSSKPRLERIGYPNPNYDPLDDDDDVMLPQVVLTHISYGYNDNYCLSSIEYTNEKIRIDFNQSSTNKLIISFVDVSDQNNDVLFRKTTYSLTGSYISGIVEQNSYLDQTGKMVFSYEGNKVIEISKYNSNNSLIENILYDYFDQRTVVTNIRNDEVNYLFDNIGRVRTIIPKKYMFQSNNCVDIYDKNQIEYISSKKPLVLSKNLLSNSNFRYYNSSNVLENWTVQGTGICNLCTDSEYGGRVVLLSAGNGSSITMFQTIHVSSGNYRFKTRLKNTHGSSLVVKATLTWENQLNGLTSGEEYILDTSTIRDGWEDFESSIIEVIGEMVNPSIQISFSLPSSCVELNKYYVDYVMLSNIAQCGDYNIIENGLFERVNSNNKPLKWNFANLSSGDLVSGLYNFVGANKRFFVHGLASPFTTKRIYQSIPIKGEKGNRYCFSSIIKCDASATTFLCSVVKISYLSIGDKEYRIWYDCNCCNYQSIVSEIVSEDDFDSIEISFEYNGYSDLSICYASLTKNVYATKSDYIKNNSIGSFQDGLKSLQITASSKVTISPDGHHKFYMYDSHKRISSVTDINGNGINYVYNAKGDITTESVCFENELIERTTDYDLFGNYEVTDEFNNTTTYSLDDSARIVDVLYPNASKISYSYNYFSNVVSVSYQYNNDSFTNYVAYDNLFDYENIITTPTNSTYAKNYDDSGRIISAHHSSGQLISLCYDNNISSNNYGNVISKKIGTYGPQFTFNYDDNHRIRYIEKNSVLFATYDYDAYSRTKTVKDETNNTITVCNYGENDKLTKVAYGNNVTKYCYDDSGFLREKIIKNSYNQHIVGFIDKSDCIKRSRDGYINRFIETNGCEVFIAPLRGVGENGSPFLANTSEVVVDLEIAFEVFRFSGVSRYLGYDFPSLNPLLMPSNNEPGYDQSKWLNECSNSKSFYLIFKPTGLFGTEYNLLTFAKKEQNGSFSKIGYLNLNSAGYLQYKENGNIKFTSHSPVSISSWNCLSMNFIGDAFSMYLNDDSIVSFGSNFLASDISRFFVSYQNDMQWALSSYNFNPTISFNLALLAVSNKARKPSEIIEGWNKFFVQNIDTSTENATVVNSINNSFGFISFNMNFVSSTGLTPIYKMVNSDSLFSDKGQLFCYLPSIKRNVYRSFSSEAMSQPLCYDFDFEGCGTISINFYCDSTAGGTRNILNAFSDYSKLKIYISNNILYLKKETGTAIELNTPFSFDVWHNLYLYFSNGQLSVCLDGGTPYTTTTLDLSDCVFYFGCDVNGSNNKIGGYIDSISYSRECIQCSSSIINSFTPKVICESLDKMGRITTKSIYSNNVNVFSQTYSFNCYRITSETMFGETYSYGYDTMGNIVSKTNGNPLELFAYDKLNRITSHCAGLLLESFTYDDNGNVVSYQKGINTTYTFEYTNDCITTIKKNNNTFKTFTYDMDYLHISSITENNTTKQLTWSGNRLIAIDDNIEYRYNEKGIRIYKKVDDEITTFVLEGDNVSSMTKTINNVTHTFIFTYDNCNRIVGFVYKGNQYFYIRDITGSILHIINSDGIRIVSYSYSAYGVPSIEYVALSPMQSVAIGALNPFLYKGYFYDPETGFYYLKSRYYDPSIMRFISIDDISYLDSSDLRGTNLFAYCKCNPIMYYDVNGCIVSDIVVGVFWGIIIGIAISLVNDWRDDGSVNCSIGWREYVGNIVGGAISGAGVGLVSSVLTGAFGNIVQSAIEEDINSLSDFAKSLSVGASLGAMSYSITYVINKIAEKEIIEIIGNSSNNAIINKRLAKNGLGHFKIGRDGFEKIFKEFYRTRHYDLIELVLKNSLEFFSGLFPFEK